MKAPQPRARRARKKAYPNRKIKIEGRKGIDFTRGGSSKRCQVFFTLHRDRAMTNHQRVRNIIEDGADATTHMDDL